MHLLDSAPFGRILPARVTPMKSDGSVDCAAAQKLAKYLVADTAHLARRGHVHAQYRGAK